MFERRVPEVDYMNYM
jgi:hypothetical protein